MGVKDIDPIRLNTPHKPTYEELEDLVDTVYGFKDGGFQYYKAGNASLNCRKREDFADAGDYLADDERLKESEAVEHPDHYAKDRKYEPYKVIYDWDLNFNLGNAVKYISRLGRKGPADKKREDILKAIEYLQFELELMEEE